MASPVVYFVRRGHLPISRFLLFAIVTLWGCGSQAPAAVSSQQQSPQRLSQLQLLARSPGVAIRLLAKGGTPQLYRLPRLTAVEGVLRGKLPPVERVVGLDPEAEFLFVTTAKHELLAVDLGSGRVDTVAVAIAQAALGPDGTLYAVDTLRHVISLSRRTRFTWPQPLTALPRDLFGATDQHLVGVIPQDRLLIAAADQPPTVRPIAAGGDVTASRWGDLVAVASDSGVTFYDPLGRRDPAFVKLADAPRALAFSPSGHRITSPGATCPGSPSSIATNARRSTASRSPALSRRCASTRSAAGCSPAPRSVIRHGSSICRSSATPASCRRNGVPICRPSRPTGC